MQLVNPLDLIGVADQNTLGQVECTIQHMLLIAADLQHVVKSVEQYIMKIWHLYKSKKPLVHINQFIT